MGVNTPSLISESVTCPWCRVATESIQRLQNLMIKGGIDSRTYNLKLNDLLTKAKDAGLTPDQRKTLDVLISDFNQITKSADNIAKQTENAKTVINKYSNTLSNISDNAAQYTVDFVKLYETSGFVDDFFKIHPSTKTNIKSLEDVFSNTEKKEARLNTFNTFDDYFDRSYKPSLEKKLTEKGYDELFMSKIIEKYRELLKKNPIVGGAWSSKIVVGYDTSKFLKTINNFISSTDNIKKVALLKTLKKEEKEILNSFLLKNINEISPGLKISNIDELMDVTKTLELTNLSKSLVNDREFLKKLLLDISKLEDDVVKINSGIEELGNLTNTFKVEQVVGVKINEDELSNINKIIDEKGYSQSWGWDSNLSEPISVTTKVNGENVKFTLSDYGPRRYDGNRAYSDKLFEQFEDEYNKLSDDAWDRMMGGSGSLDEIPFEQFLKNKFKNNDQMLDKYFPKYKVSGGVKLTDDNGTVWVIVNPLTLKNKNSVDFVTFHEMTHVNQKSGEMTKADRYRSNFKSPQEALDFLNNKTKTNIDKGYSETPSLTWNVFLRDDPNAEKIINRYMDETGQPNPKNSFENFEKFQKWSLDNKGVVDEKFYQYGKNIEEITKNNFSDEVKKRSLLLSLEDVKGRLEFAGVPLDKVNRIISMVTKLSDDKLNTFIKNSIDDPMIEGVVMDSARRLGYNLNTQEIEANFTALIREIMERGTDKENAGFATWLVNWLKSNNKLEKIEGYQNPNSLKDRILNNISGSENEFQKTEFQKYANTASVEFWDFLKLIEKEYKQVYPDDTKKLYSKLYKQSYELISKGFPVVAGIVFAGKGLGGEDTTQTTNESVNKTLKLILEINRLNGLMSIKK